MSQNSLSCKIFSHITLINPFIYSNADRELNKVDCSELLFKTNREIKSLNYKLMRVITSDDYHTVLQPFRQNDIEVIEQTHILCKVNVKGQLAPARFLISFKNDPNNNA